MVTWGTENGFLGWQLSRRWWFLWFGNIIVDVFLPGKEFNFHCDTCCWFSLTLGPVSFSVLK